MAGLGIASYTAPASSRQSRWPQGRSAFVAMLAISAFGLGGCSTIMMPLSGWTSTQNGPPPGEVVTGSIPHTGVATPAPDSDGEIVRRTVETAARDHAAGRIEWKNPATGNSGAITELVEAKASNGADCRDFATTLTSIEGVRMWRGRACRGYSGPWDLVDFGPGDGRPAG